MQSPPDAFVYVNSDKAAVLAAGDFVKFYLKISHNPAF